MTVFSMEKDLQPIILGNVALPNAVPLESDVGAMILHYREYTLATRFCRTETRNGRRGLPYYGQGGQLYGSGIAAWTEWKDGAYRATAMKFAICDHKPVEGAAQTTCAAGIRPAAGNAGSICRLIAGIEYDRSQQSQIAGCPLLKMQVGIPCPNEQLGRVICRACE